MKILYIEDQACFFEEGIKELSTIGEVVHFKSSNGARRYLLENEHSLPDLVVCDHQILRFEGETFRKATGDEVYFDLRAVNQTIPFLHYSSEPCPEEYNPKDPHFHYKKKGTIPLLTWLKQLKLI